MGVYYMLEFVQALTKLVAAGDSSTQWEVGEIARDCDYPCHRVFEYLSIALGDGIDVREPISRSTLLQALVILKEKTRPQFILQQKRMLEQREKALKNYQIIMGKVRNSQQRGEWRKAYRSLSYYVSDNAHNLPVDLLLTIYNDCLRLGIKSGTNLQDLGGWLRRVVDVVLQDSEAVSLQDAIDFLDTYQDEFLNDASGAGSKLLRNIIMPLRERVLSSNMPLHPLLAS